jgi:ABC-type taurine transport system substrate-binding protein
MSERPKDPEWKAVIKYYDGLDGADKKAIGLLVALSYVQEGRTIVVTYQQIEDECMDIEDAESAFAKMQSAGLIEVRNFSWGVEITFNQLPAVADG